MKAFVNLFKVRIGAAIALAAAAGLAVEDGAELVLKSLSWLLQF